MLCWLDGVPPLQQRWLAVQTNLVVVITEPVSWDINWLPNTTGSRAKEGLTSEWKVFRLLQNLRKLVHGASD